MIQTSIAKLSEEIGYDIGASDDVTQAKLFNGFCKGLNNSCKSDADLQICYMTERLDDNAKKILGIIVEYMNTKA